jgi:hypothetical protein
LPPSIGSCAPVVLAKSGPAIARKAFTGYDPTGIDANHFYEDSIAAHPPAWSKGPGVVKKPLGHFIFIYNPKDA